MNATLLKRAILAAITFLMFVIGFGSPATALAERILLSSDYHRTYVAYTERTNDAWCDNAGCVEFVRQLEQVERLNEAVCNGNCDSYRGGFGGQVFFARGIQSMGGTPTMDMFKDRQEFFRILSSADGSLMMMELLKPQEQLAMAELAAKTQKVFRFRRAQTEEIAASIMSGQLQASIKDQLDAEQARLAPIEAEVDAEVARYKAEAQPLPEVVVSAPTPSVSVPVDVTALTARIEALEADNAELRQQAADAHYAEMNATADKIAARGILEAAEAARDDARNAKAEAAAILVEVTKERKDAEAAMNETIKLKGETDGFRIQAKEAYDAAEQLKTQIDSLLGETKVAGAAAEKARDEAISARNQMIFGSAIIGLLVLLGVGSMLWYFLGVVRSERELAEAAQEAAEKAAGQARNASNLAQAHKVGAEDAERRANAKPVAPLAVHNGSNGRHNGSGHGENGSTVPFTCAPPVLPDTEDEKNQDASPSDTGGNGIPNPTSSLRGGLKPPSHY